MYNLLLASSYPVIINGLSAMVNEALPEIASIQTANSLAQLEMQLANGQNQMLILDLRIFILDGTQSYETSGLKTLTLRYPSVKIIILQDKVEMMFFKWMYQIGIKGILGKAAPLKDFFNCIQKVYKNEIYIENKVLISFIDVPVSKNKYYNGVTLTPRERLIAELLIEGKNNTQICTTLNLRPSTVSTFKQHVFRKLQVSNLLELEKIRKIAV